MVMTNICVLSLTTMLPPSTQENVLNHSNLSIDSSQSKQHHEASLQTLKRKIYAQRRHNKSMHDAIVTRLPSFHHELTPRTKREDSRSLISHYDTLLEEAAFLERYMAKLECIGQTQNESENFRFMVDGWRKGCGLESCDEMIDRLGKNIRFVRQGIETAAKQTKSQALLIDFVKQSQEYRDLQRQLEEVNAERQIQRAKFTHEITDLTSRNGQLQKINQQLLTKNKQLQTNEKRLTIKLETLKLQLQDSSTISNRTSKEYISSEKDTQNRPLFHIFLTSADTHSAPTITTRPLYQIIDFLDYTPSENSLILQDISLSNISLDLTGCSEHPSINNDLLLGLDKLPTLNRQPSAHPSRPKTDRSRQLHFSNSRLHDPPSQLRFIRRK